MEPHRSSPSNYSFSGGNYTGDRPANFDRSAFSEKAFLSSPVPARVSPKTGANDNGVTAIRSPHLSSFEGGNYSQGPSPSEARRLLDATLDPSYKMLRSTTFEGAPYSSANHPITIPSSLTGTNHRTMSGNLFRSGQEELNESHSANFQKELEQVRQQLRTLVSTVEDNAVDSPVKHHVHTGNTSVGNEGDTVGTLGSEMSNPFTQLKASLEKSASSGATEAMQSFLERERHSMMAEFQREVSKLDKERADMRTREAEQKRVVQQCLWECDVMKQREVHKEESLVRFQQELSIAADTLMVDRKKFIDAGLAKDRQIELLSREVDLLTSSLKEESSRYDSIQKHVVEQQQQFLRYKQEQEQVMNEKTSEFARVQARLQSEIERLEATHQETLAKVADRSSKDLKAAGDVKSKMRTLEGDVQRLDMEVLALQRERDALKSEISLLQARHTTEISKLESRHQASLEQEIARKMLDMQERVSVSDGLLREQHADQIAKLLAKHTDESRTTSARFQEELDKSMSYTEKIKNEFKRNITELQHKLAHAQATVTTLASNLQQNESTHSEQLTQLGSQLQQALRSQYASVSRIAADLAASSKHFTEDLSQSSFSGRGGEGSIPAASSPLAASYSNLYGTSSTGSSGLGAREQSKSTPGAHRGGNEFRSFYDGVAVPEGGIRSDTFEGKTWSGGGHDESSSDLVPLSNRMTRSSAALELDISGIEPHGQSQSTPFSFERSPRGDHNGTPARPNFFTAASKGADSGGGGNFAIKDNKKMDLNLDLSQYATFSFRNGESPGVGLNKAGDGSTKKQTLAVSTIAERGGIARDYKKPWQPNYFHHLVRSPGHVDDAILSETPEGGSGSQSILSPGALSNLASAVKLDGKRDDRGDESFNKTHVAFGSPKQERTVKFAPPSPSRVQSPASPPHFPRRGKEDTSRIWK